MKLDGGLRGIFRKYLPFMHWQTVEMAYGITGVPDSNYGYHGVEGWVEFKKTSAYSVKFQFGQVGWAERRASEGCRVTLAVRRRVEAGPRKKATDELWLFDGTVVGLVDDGGLQAAKPLMVTRGGPSKWEWGFVYDILMRRIRYAARSEGLADNPHVRLNLRRGSSQRSSPDQALVRRAKADL